MGAGWWGEAGALQSFVLCILNPLWPLNWHQTKRKKLHPFRCIRCSYYSIDCAIMSNTSSFYQKKEHLKQHINL